MSVYDTRDKIYKLTEKFNGLFTVNDVYKSQRKYKKATIRAYLSNLVKIKKLKRNDLHKEYIYWRI